MCAQPYTPAELREDRLLFDVFGGNRNQRLLFINLVSLLVTITLLSGIHFLAVDGSMVKRVVLPSKELFGNAVQITTVLFGIRCMIFALDRIYYFRRESKLLRDHRLHNVIIRSLTGGCDVGIAALRELPPNFKGIAYFRILSVIEEQKDSGNLDALQRICKDRWRVENERLVAEYSVTNVLVWAMPILGFIGTVIGISIAVGNFASFLSVSGNEIPIALIKERLSEVANGLAFAFDTTLLGLVFSLFAMLMLSVGNSIETEFMTRLDAISSRLVERGAQFSENDLSRISGRL